MSGNSISVTLTNINHQLSSISYSESYSITIFLNSALSIAVISLGLIYSRNSFISLFTSLLSGYSFIIYL